MAISFVHVCIHVLHYQCFTVLPIHIIQEVTHRIVTALVWTNSLKCPRTEEAFNGSRAQP